MTTRTVTESEALRWLALEHQFCVKCWSVGLRVQVISASEKVGRTTAQYRALRRRRLAAHLRKAHAMG